jgi:hypothetical protein
MTASPSATSHTEPTTTLAAVKEQSSWTDAITLMPTMWVPRLKQREETIERLQDRYKDQPEAYAEHARGVVDRQINKAGGLLSVDALLLAVLTVGPAQTVLEENKDLVRWSCALLLTSALLCFVALFTRWGKPQGFADPITEGTSAWWIIAVRAWYLNLATALGCLVVAACLLVLVLSLLEQSNILKGLSDLCTSLAPTAFGAGVVLGLWSRYRLNQDERRGRN